MNITFENYITIMHVNLMRNSPNRFRIAMLMENRFDCLFVHASVQVWFKDVTNKLILEPII